MRRLLALLFLLAAPATALAAGPPDVTTGSAGPVGAQTAGVRGTIDPNGTDTIYRFEYTTGDGTTFELVTADQTRTAAEGPGTVQTTLSGLTPNTTYRYRLVARHPGDPDGVVTGSTRTLRTIAAPGVGTGYAGSTRVDGTTLSGRVDANRSPTRWWYEYGTTRSYGARTPPADAGRSSTARTISARLDGLEPNTVYHYRLVAQNAAGTTYGRDRHFRTLRAPSAITLTTAGRRVDFGSVTQITGQVQGTGVARIRVALEAQPFPFTAPFVEAGSVITGTNGSFRLPSPPLWISTRFRVVTKSVIVATSETLTALSRVLVDADATALDARRSVIEGSVTPRVPRARVSLQRRGARGRWVTVRRTTARFLAPGRFGYRVTVQRWRRPRAYRVVVRPRNQAHTAGTSRHVKVPKRARR
jgi:hypothetical protein